MILIWEVYKNTKRSFRAASEEARKPLLPPEVEVQLGNRSRSPIAAHQNNPAHFSFSPARFPLASVPNIPIVRKVGGEGSLPDYGNISEWPADRNDGGPYHVIAKNVDPEAA